MMSAEDSKPESKTALAALGESVVPAAQDTENEELAVSPGSTPNKDIHPSPEDIAKALELSNQGVMARNARQLDHSVELFTMAIDLYPSNADFYANRSLAYAFLKGKVDLALQDANQALSIYVSLIGYRAKGIALRRLKRYDEAMVEFNNALALASNNDDINSVKEDMANVYGDQAYFASRAGEYARVPELATKAIELQPSSTEYYARRSYALGCLGTNYELALQDAEKSLSLGLTSDGYVAKGMILRLLGRYDEAGNELMKGWGKNMWGKGQKDLASELAAVHFAQAVIACESGQYKQAIDRASSAIEFSPQSGHYTLRSVARAYIGNDLKRALKDAEQSLTLSKTAHGYCAKGTVLNSQKKHDKALDELELGLALVGEDSQQRNALMYQKAIAFYGKGVVAETIGQYGQAIEWVSKAIELFPYIPQFYTSRSLAHLNAGQGFDLALQDAEASLKLFISAEGYRMKGIALAEMKSYDEARIAFDLGLEIASDDHDRQSLTVSKAKCLPMGFVPSLHGLRNARTASRDVIQMAQDIVAKTPIRLIDTQRHFLCEKDERLQAFIDSTEYKQLMTRMVGGEISELADIQKVVTKFFEFAMLSHRWEIGEPTLRDVRKGQDGFGLAGMVKLKKFCSIASSLGYRWAWSDTCCIDKSSSTELQRSIISMVVWYQRSSITIVYLSDMDNDSPESFAGSLWFKRGWTLQELLAPSVIRFYKADWTPYMDGKDIPFNHKEYAPLLDLLHDISGIEKGMLRHFTANVDDSREKLRWAAGRRTTEEEDSAYSLMGIFNIQIPVMYGESQDKVVGRLLQELIGYSSDLSILQWRGRSGSFNSCIPDSISAFQDKPWTPRAMSASDLLELATRLRRNVTRSAKAQISDAFSAPHPSPTFLHSRLLVSCIVHAVDMSTRTLGGCTITVKGLKPFRLEVTEIQSASVGPDGDTILVRPLDVRLAAPLTKKGIFGRHLGEVAEKLAQLQQSFYGLVLSRRVGGYYKRVAGVVVNVDDVVQYVEHMRVERLEIA